MHPVKWLYKNASDMPKIFLGMWDNDYLNFFPTFGLVVTFEVIFMYRELLDNSVVLQMEKSVALSFIP